MDANKELINKILKRREPGDCLSATYLYALLLANPGRYGIPDIKAVPDLRTFETACIEHCKTHREDRQLFVEVM